MRRSTKTKIAATTASVVIIGPLLALESLPLSLEHRLVARSHQPDAPRALGNLSLRSAQAGVPPQRLNNLSTPSAVPSANAPSLSPSAPLSPAQRAQQALNAGYFTRILRPAIKQSNVLAVVEPIHTDQDPVNNVPGQFIVDGAHNPDCGSQFSVNLSSKSISPQSRGTITVNVFGKLDIIRDGTMYGRAAYGGYPGVGHAESTLDPAFPFVDTLQAVNHLALLTQKVCSLAAIKGSN